MTRFFPSYLATPTTNRAQIFTGLLFYAYYVEIHQVGRLVFDNYQQCQMSLKTTKKTDGVNFKTNLGLAEKKIAERDLN